MADTQQNPKYDLEERTYQFAKQVRMFVKQLPRTISNQEDVRQLVRCSGSVGANYIEANNALGRKDFLMRVRTARKEAKESRYFLRLIDTGSANHLDEQRKVLIAESAELTKILGAIIKKTETPGVLNKLRKPIGDSF